MYEQVEKSEEKKIAKTITQKKKNQNSQFLDNRPKAMIQRKSQASGKNVSMNSQLVQLKIGGENEALVGRWVKTTGGAFGEIKRAFKNVQTRNQWVYVLEMLTEPGVYRYADPNDDTYTLMTGEEETEIPASGGTWQEGPVVPETIGLSAISMQMPSTGEYTEVDGLLMGRNGLRT